MFGAFGRDDMDSVKLLIRDPNGNYRIDHEISSDDDGIRDTSQGIFGTHGPILLAFHREIHGRIGNY